MKTYLPLNRGMYGEAKTLSTNPVSRFTSDANVSLLPGLDEECAWT